MLQRPVDRVALRRAQLLEIGLDSLARRAPALAVAALQVPRDLFAGEHGLGDLVEHRHDPTIPPLHSQTPNRKDWELARERRLDTNRSLMCAPTSFRQMASVNSIVLAVPPRSRVRTLPSASTSPSAFIDAVGHRAFVDVAQHQQRRQQQRRGVGDALAGDVGRAAVHRLEHADLDAEVRRRHDAEPADQPGAQVRHDVAVEVRHQQHVELRRVHHQVHAGGVDDPLVADDVGILARPPSSRT